jgi:hypothetical protein
VQCKPPEFIELALEDCRLMEPWLDATEVDTRELNATELDTRELEMPELDAPTTPNGDGCAAHVLREIQLLLFS